MTMSLDRDLNIAAYGSGFDVHKRLPLPADGSRPLMDCAEPSRPRSSEFRWRGFVPVAFPGVA